MKIAATYDNGNIFQHFGRTQFFKIYNVEDNQVTSSEVIGSNGEGHGALAGILADEQVDVLICGGIGPGAQNALDHMGIQLVSGAEGDADQAVEAFLKGELVSAGATCDHHSGEHEHGCHGHEGGEHGCHGHEGGEEGHDCHHGNCGGGTTHGSALKGRNVNKTCRVHYRGTFDNGEQFDSSYDRNEPLEFVCGAGMMIKGFDRAVADMEVGQIVDVHLQPEEAYGMPDPNQILEIAIKDLPGAEELNVGDQVYLQTPSGRPVPVKVTARDQRMITLDANHEMAGKALNFRIELVEVL